MIRYFLLDGAPMGRCNAGRGGIMDWITCWVWVWGIAWGLAIGASAGVAVAREFDFFLRFEFDADLRKLKYNIGGRRFRALKIKRIRGCGWPLF